MSSLSQLRDKIKKKYSKVHHKLVKTSAINLSNDKIKKISIRSRIFIIIFTISWYSFILYYLNNLEDQTCNCDRNWRHTYLKIISYINICASFIPLLNININLNPIYILFIEITIILLNAVYIYTLYTYIDDLNSANCACAIQKQPKLNYLLNDRKKSILIIYILGIITVIANIDLGITFHFNKKSYKYKI
jgi:hypothetical protein